MCEDGGEADGREDVHVVALLRGECDGFIFIAVIVVGGGGLMVGGGKRGTRGKETAAVGVLDGVREGAFGFRGWVGEREDDGSVVDACHLLEDGGREGAADGGETHENGRLDDVNQFAERFDLSAGVVRAGEINFVIGEFVTAIEGDEALCRVRAI